MTIRVRKISARPMKSIKKIRPTNSFFRYLENKYHTLLSMLKVFRIIIASLSLKNVLLPQIFTHSHKPRKNIFVRHGP